MRLNEDFTAVSEKGRHMEQMTIKRCPFCGGRMDFHVDHNINRRGNPYTEMYWMHDETDCVLNDIYEPFILGAGDARPEEGYPGEYAQKWNHRVSDGTDDD